MSTPKAADKSGSPGEPRSDNAFADETPRYPHQGARVAHGPKVFSGLALIPVIMRRPPATGPKLTLEPSRASSRPHAVRARPKRVRFRAAAGRRETIMARSERRYRPSLTFSGLSRINREGTGGVGAITVVRLHSEDKLLTRIVDGCITGTGSGTVPG